MLRRCWFTCILMLICTSVSAQDNSRVLLHRFGETTVSGLPERVVSLSFIGHDFLLGLGIKPIALRYWYGDGPFGVWPWAADALEDAEPVVIYGGIDVETIALLEPDLILAQWSGITETEYELLSQIAPTLPPPEGATDYSASWQQMTRQIGLAMGIQDTAEAQIAELEGRIDEIRTSHHNWDGLTASAVWPENVVAYTGQDIRGQFLEQLGFTNAPDVERLVGSNVYSVRIAAEDLSPIDTDLLLWLTVGDPQAAFDRIGLRDYLRAHQEGREIVADPVLTAALSHSSPLALEYALDRLIPMIEAAVDGDPSTLVATAREASE